MNNWMLVLVLLAMAAVAYQLGLTRSRRVQLSGTVLHSRPVHHGVYLALWTALPAFLVLTVWWLAESAVVEVLVLQSLPTYDVMSVEDQVVALRRIEQLASGFGVLGTVDTAEAAAAQTLLRLQQLSDIALVALLATLMALGFWWARRHFQANLRARNHVEQVVTFFLGLSSVIAILTTVGIVVSMLKETLNFFSFIPAIDFFFGTVWNPGFATVGNSFGDYGLLPLLWGTVMISLIAMLVAVPIGLMAAIYLAEYAPRSVRNVVKPAIEILAGIPTIVYGVFALMVVGPALTAMGEAVGLTIRGTSALTAGVVMGIMIIPFISSLSDDIITQVPRSLRDGSLGLGATRSETIRRVVLPAALPGIVGAFLLAVSRAIGETMIVVLAAGNSPVLHANPFEAISTVTVSIVKALTGDSDFAGPQSLVAFALGLTLFALTLLLNVVALVIVRRYREQYE